MVSCLYTAASQEVVWHSIEAFRNELCRNSVKSRGKLGSSVILVPKIRVNLCKDRGSQLSRTFVLRALGIPYCSQSM